MQIQKRKKRKLSDMKGMYFFGNDFASLCVRVGVFALKTPPPILVWFSVGVTHQKSSGRGPKRG